MTFNLSRQASLSPVQSLTFLCLLLLTFSAACASKPEKRPPAPTGLTILEAVVREPELSDFLGYLQQAKFHETLKQDGPITLFAPTNSAIAKVKARWDKQLKDNPDAFLAELKYHVINTRFVGGLEPWYGKRIATANGHEVLIRKGKINSATLLSAEVRDLKNGGLCVIDEVLSSSD